MPSFLPTACNMPDLSSLEAQHTFANYLLHQVLGAGDGFPETMASYRRNMVRLADKAVQNYMDARRCVIAQIAEGERLADEMINSGRPLYMLTAPNHLEDCIITVRRLFAYFSKVKTDPSGFPLDRLMRNQIEHLEASIRDVRDLIEHLDADISGGLIPQGGYTAPALDAECRTISLAGVVLPSETLARAIRHFHEFAQQFGRYRMGSNGDYEFIPSSGRLRPV